MEFSSSDDLSNKPTIPAAQVNSDWNADSGVAQILNKPTIPTVNDATLTIQHNGTNVQTFTANSSTNKTANIETIYAETITPTTDVATIGTTQIADGAVTKAKIDWSTIFTDGLDTGWVSATSYINTTYFSARDSNLFSYRILCGVVYWRGEIYCHTAPSSNQVNILNNLPEKIRSSGQINIYGSQFDISNSEYTIWTENDHMVLRQIKQNISKTNNYQGYNFGQLQYISRSMTG